MAEEKKSKSSCGCCILKILGASFAFFLVLLGLFIWYVVSSISWVENAAQPAPAKFPQPSVTSNEEQDAERVIKRLQAGRNQTGLIDETITPAVFNRVFDEIHEGEKKKGKPDNLVGMRVDIVGEQCRILYSQKLTSKSGDKPVPEKYLNVDALFDLEMADGKMTKGEVNNLSIGGQDAPWGLRIYVNYVLGQIRDGTNKDVAEGMKKLSYVKMLKREGPLIHIILDPSKFDVPEDDVPMTKSNRVEKPTSEPF